MAVITEQLLASLGVDLAELEVYLGGRYAVIQRDPQPDEEDIPVDTDIQLMIVDLEGDPLAAGSGGGFGGAPFGHFPFGHPPPGGSPNAFDFEVYVESILILSYVAGTPTWSGGFTGTVEEAVPEDPYWFYRVTAQQVSPPMFISEQVVDVQVIVNSTAPLLDITYPFIAEDLTPPSIISAKAIDQYRVRIGFDDNMAVEGPGSALRPEAYTLTTLNEDPKPGVSLEVVAVTEVPGSDATQFDLEFQWEQTPVCLYQIDVDPSVTDSSGNEII